MVVLGVRNGVKLLDVGSTDLGDGTAATKGTLSTLLAGEDLTNNVLATVAQPLAVNTHALSWSDSIGVAGVVVKAAAGTVYTLWGVNRNAATRYVQIFNATAAPVDGTAPAAAPIPVPSGQSFSLDLSPFGKYFSTGVYVCSSTTAATKTLGSADMDISVGYA